MAKPAITKKAKTPFITINKLAEYTTAKAIRRRQIVKSFIKDNDFAKIYYSELKNLFSPFVKSGFDMGILDTVHEKLEKRGEDPAWKASSTDWEKNDNSNTLQAIENLQDCDLPDLEDYEVITDDFNVKKVKLEGVTVSIKPDVYLRNKTSGKIGAIKFHIAKTAGNQLLEANRINAATLIKYGLIEHGVPETKIDHKACISIDVFDKGHSVAPTAFRRTIGSLGACCEEIALRWEVL